ncbi:hypothetical protein ACQJ0Y_07880 [Peribacillus simplex]|uniref:hypothetical protein n=1 Tax=Peribacillus simplex TaxID=1478 RepID=UPI003CF2494C
MNWWELLKELFGVSFAQNLFTGLIIFFIGNIFTKIKAKKDYIIALKQANSKVFYMLRRLISEQELPNKEILLAMHNSIARDLKVMPEDMDSYDVISENLVKEIMDTDFLSHDEKLKYSSKALTIKQQIKEHSILNSVEKQETEKGVRPFILNVLKDVVNTTLFPSSSPIIPLALGVIPLIIGVTMQIDKTFLTKLGSEMGQSNFLIPLLSLWLFLIFIAIFSLFAVLKKQQREQESKTRQRIIEYRKRISEYEKLK